MVLVGSLAGVLSWSLLRLSASSPSSPVPRRARRHGGAGVAVGAYQPAYDTLVAAVTPSHLRAQTYAWAIRLLGGGAVISPIVAALGDRTSCGVTLAVVATTPLAGGASSPAPAGRCRPTPTRRTRPPSPPDRRRRRSPAETLTA